MKLRTWIASGAVLIVVLAIAGFFVGRHLVRTRPAVARLTNTPLPVSVVEAKPREVSEVLGATGSVAPVEILNLTGRVAVRVEKVPVDLGDVVAVGQVLVQFDRSVLAAAVSAAEEEVRRAAAEIARLTPKVERIKSAYQGGLATSILKAAEAARDEGTADLARAKDKVQRVKVTYESGLAAAIVKTAEAARDGAAADLARAREKVRRVKTIVDQRLLPKIELETAEGELDRAKAAYQKAEEDLLKARKDLPLELERAEAELGRAKADHSTGLQRLAGARQDLAYATLVSPVPGIVMERKVNPGETPQVSERLFTIGRIDQVLVAAQIPEERAGDIHLGQPATVTFNAFPNEVMTGAVSRIKPVTAQDTKTFVVDVKLANPELRLKPGLTAFVRLTRARQALGVPSIALVNPTGLRESYVFVVGNGSIARLTRVRVGASGDGVTEILEGLKPSERVVTVGHMHLRDGDRVRIGEEFEQLKMDAARKDGAAARRTP